MTKVQHGEFTVERVLDAPPSLVFQAWSDKTAKAKWFGSGSQLDVSKMDFRVGGEEIVSGKWPNGTVSEFRARYFDIVKDKRIVYTYDLLIDGKKLSVSLATIQILAEGKKTRMIVTEQGAFLDGYDDAGAREHGTNALMDKLVESLKPAH
ncbi:MAG TPA: SRPBCC family protein [Rhizomicrobium sp.]